jgi:lipoprotein-releasing system permease protein
MILAIAVVMGFKYTITEKLYSFMGHVHVVPFSGGQSPTLAYSEPIQANQELANAIRKIPHVRAVTPFATRPVIVQAHGQLEGVQLKGVNSQYSFPEGIATSGAPIDFSDSFYSKQIMLSQTTADRLSVTSGDTVQVDFIQNGIPRIRRVRVAGLYHSGMDEIDKVFGLCDIRLIQRINNWPADSINGYQVDVDEARFADTVSNFIHYHLINPPIESYTTTENYSFIFDWLELQSVNGRILLAIMGIVSIINMAAVLLILIVDRASMIGLLKALGMPFEGTRNVFLALAALIGTTGILLGNILALGLCWLQTRFGIFTLPEQTYYMKYVPIRIIWWQVALIDVVTLVVCILCMWLPTLYIRRVHPARVLQFK